MIWNRNARKMIITLLYDIIMVCERSKFMTIGLSGLDEKEARLNEIHKAFYKYAPLDENTLDLMNKEAFHQMKKTAIFLNLGRGPIVVEEDLAEALEQGEIAAAGLDVLRVEPMSPENPLRRIKDSEKLLITPHIAWASVEARTRLMEIICGQIQEFFSNGSPES